MGHCYRISEEYYIPSIVKTYMSIGHYYRMSTKCYIPSVGNMHQLDTVTECLQNVKSLAYTVKNNR